MIVSSDAFPDDREYYPTGTVAIFIVNNYLTYYLQKDLNVVTSWCFSNLIIYKIFYKRKLKKLRNVRKKGKQLMFFYDKF